jgi:6-pyruvoyltetrahydropterin/6-carboxytetrahydropterin synthase
MFKVRVSKDRTSFSAAHFITYDGGSCETLHGHNYRITAMVEGESLAEDSYLIDFSVLKDRIEAICRQLDHRMLVPITNSRLKLTQEDGRISIAYKNKEYVFPKEDVVLLPISNSTCEELAGWIGNELAQSLPKSCQGTGVKSIEVEVEESLGQSASWKKVFTYD